MRRDETKRQLPKFEHPGLIHRMFVSSRAPTRFSLWDWITPVEKKKRILISSKREVRRFVTKKHFLRREPSPLFERLPVLSSRSLFSSGSCYVVSTSRDPTEVPIRQFLSASLCSLRPPSSILLRVRPKVESRNCFFRRTITKKRRRRKKGDRRTSSFSHGDKKEKKNSEDRVDTANC